MLNQLIYFSLFLFSYSFLIKNNYYLKYKTLEYYYEKNFNSKIKRCDNINAIKIIDNNIDNKTIYEKFEYYSLIGDSQKQQECFREILLLSNKTSN